MASQFKRPTDQAPAHMRTKLPTPPTPEVIDLCVGRLPYAVNQDGEDVYTEPEKKAKAYDIVEALLDPERWPTTKFGSKEGFGLPYEKAEVIAGSLLTGQIGLGWYPCPDQTLDDCGLGYVPFSTTAGVGGAEAIARKTLKEMLTDRFSLGGKASG